jgi:hypothetical protein
MNENQLVAIVNHSTVVSEDDVARAVAALQRQVTYHFRPYWNASATLLIVDSTPAGRAGDMAGPDIVDQLPPEAWLLAVMDDSDQAGALGYHKIDQTATPVGFVFAKTDQENNLEWTVTLSHEALEMLGDPYANLVVQIRADGTAVACESADAVEADDLGYDIDGVRMSDFVTPHWFIAGSPGPWDYRGHCSQALQLLPGGYIGVWEPNRGWTQVTAQGAPRHTEGPRFRLRRDGRGLPAASALPEWMPDVTRV